jgi:hypothetical protein
LVKNRRLSNRSSLLKYPYMNKSNFQSICYGTVEKA